MSENAVAGLCRLRVRTRSKSFELAVPAEVPLADLLPALASYADLDAELGGAEHGGWVLQRLGGDPLDEESTLRALELRDGDEVYLLPRHEALPPVHFDDLVDAMSTALRDRKDSWRPQWTYRLLVGAVLLALLVGAVLLTLPGPAGLRCVTAAGTGLLLLLGAGAAARAAGDGRAGTAVGAAALLYFALAGALLPAGGTDVIDTGASLLAGSAAGGAGALLALAAVGTSVPLFFGALVTAVFAAVASGMLMAGQPPVTVAGVLAVLVVLLTPLMPAMAFRLSGLRLPLLPGNAEQLQTDIEPYPSGVVLDRTAIADRFLLAEHSVVGGVCAVALVVLVDGEGWQPVALAAALSAFLLLHGRSIGGAWHRLTALGPGLFGAVLLALRWGGDAEPAARIGVLAVLLAVAAVLAVAAWTVPGRRLVPHWGRAAELAQLFAAISLIPLLLLTLGVFGALRAMNG